MSAYDYQAPTFRNLAGEEPDHADRHIAQELEVAGIPFTVADTVTHPRAEVQTRIVAQLPGFTLFRAWYYWIVKGNVPMELAQTINNAASWCQMEIRVDGHCGCPAPEDYSHIDNYHIDTQRGLCHFVRTVEDARRKELR